VLQGVAVGATVVGAEFVGDAVKPMAEVGMRGWRDAGGTIIGRKPLLIWADPQGGIGEAYDCGGRFMAQGATGDQSMSAEIGFDPGDGGKQGGVVGEQTGAIAASPEAAARAMAAIPIAAQTLEEGLHEAAQAAEAVAQSSGRDGGASSGAYPPGAQVGVVTSGRRMVKNEMERVARERQCVTTAGKQFTDLLQFGQGAGLINRGAKEGITKCGMDSEIIGVGGANNGVAVWHAISLTLW
jgi:hypothetical protein